MATPRAPRSTTLRDRHRAALAHAQPPCALCGEPIDYTLRHPDPRSFVVDHIVALNRGGTDTLDNKQAAHRGCNRTKSDREHAPIVKRTAALRRR